tara:strand:- start:2136 stop:3236 length:1101 start_codon:yes stop_codon:yes gene_type:complete
MATIIHEPIHGDIIISDIARKIIDHPYFYRCQHIYQTGNAYKVFPSATHTRHVHMIGTYAITHKLLAKLQQFTYIDEDIKELIAIGALCHDIGHGPGSHAFDKHVIQHFIDKNIIDHTHPWITHEQRSIAMMRKIGNDIGLTENQIDFVSQVIDPDDSNKNKWMFSIVNNKKHGIDTDKLDYIVRDNYIFGLKLSIDIDTIINNSKIINNEWAFASSIHDELLNIIFTRYRFHRLLNQSQIVKFDISFRDIIINTPHIFDFIISTFNSLNLDDFSKLNDFYVFQHGNIDFINKFHDRMNYTLVNKKENFVEEVCLDIKICKQNHNPMGNILFYDIKTNHACPIYDSPLDASLPSNELITYYFKKNN